MGIIKRGIYLDVPGIQPLSLKYLLLDYTGTLSFDGILIPGVAERLEKLSQNLHITVLTADTFGKAAEQLEGSPVGFKLIRTGQDKVDFLSSLNSSETIAIGNGYNDIGMVNMSALGIAIIGPEGCHTGLIAAAKVVCNDILNALDLLQNPLRLKATMRI